MKPKTKKRPAKKTYRAIINKGKGTGVNGKVQTNGRSLVTRMVRVDARLADFLSAEAKKYGIRFTEASRMLYESVT